MSDRTRERILRAMQDADTYGHAVETVDFIQTHISWVFLAGDFVYKIKKPVDLGFLDFSSLRKRRHYCHEEVRLNSRLCPELYLGVVEIRDHDGTIRIGGDAGQVVEYAVKMRRLPEGRMLEHLIHTGEVTTGMIDEIARVLSDFHSRAETGPEIARYGSLHVVKRNWVENFDQTRRYIGDTITLEQFEFLRAWVLGWLTRNLAHLNQRKADGRVRDGHGDLRASAVCVEDELCIYDCIEFNPRMRYADVASDVAFLAMDLEAQGHPDLARRFVEQYIANSGDDGLLDVVDFYMCYRAYVRGKVESFRVDDPHIPEREQSEARAIAVARFQQAVDIAARNQPPVLVITCGLSGSGKSAVAKGVAGKLPFTVIASDRVRKELAGVEATTRQRSDFATGLYAPAFTRRTYRELLRRGGELLKSGESVILDATFSAREWRQRARTLAEESGALFFCLECRVGEAETRDRLRARANDPDLVSDANWETWVAQREVFEPVQELDTWRHIVVSTEGAVSDSVERALRQLDAHLRPAGVGDGPSAIGGRCGL